MVTVRHPRWARVLLDRFLRAVSRLSVDQLHQLAHDVQPLVGRIYRRRLVEWNLAHAFPDADAASLADGFYTAYAQFYMEVARSLSMTTDELCERVTFKGAGVLKSSKAVLLLAHHGNFVWALTAMASVLSVPVSVVYKPPHVQAMHDLLLTIATRFGVRPVPVREVRREILKHRQRSGVWAIVADQRPGENNRQYADLCGRRTAFFNGPERIARALHCPVYYLSCRREAPGRYRCVVERIAEPPFARGGATVVERYAEKLQADIDRAPEDWLWSHHRWGKRDAKAFGTG